MSADFRFTNSSSGHVGRLWGDGEKMVSIKDSHDLKIKELYHSRQGIPISITQSLRYRDLKDFYPSKELTLLYKSVTNLLYSNPNHIEKSEIKMSIPNNNSITLDAEDSSNLRIGTMHSDANTAMKFRKTHHVDIDMVFHFTKTKEEIERIFQNVSQKIQEVPAQPQITNEALALSAKLKEAYLSRDSQNCMQFYNQLTTFLATNMSIALPFVQAALNSNLL